MSMDNHYEYSEWLDLETNNSADEYCHAAAERFGSRVAELWDAFHGGDSPAVDSDELVWLTYASLAGHGVGLWEGRLVSETVDGAFETLAEHDVMLGRAFEVLENAIYDCATVED